MINKRTVTKLANRLEAHAKTTLGNRSQAKSMYKDLKKRIKLSRNETKV